MGKKRGGGGATASVLVRFRGFELMCQPDTISLYRQGKLGIDRVLISDDVMLSKGGKNNGRISDGVVMGKLEVNSMSAARDRILREGDYQMTAKERDAQTKERFRIVTNYLMNRLVDTDGRPLTAQEWERRLTETKFRVDLKESVRNQCLAAKKAVRADHVYKQIAED